MQSSMDSGKGNSKACDQCYRCKVKCTMEQSGCARCRMTKSVCTYSLGKWMGRPKKSRTRRPSSAWMRREASDGMEGRKLHQRARSISSVEYADNDDGDDDEGNEGRCGSEKQYQGPPTPNNSPDLWDMFSPSTMGMNPAQCLVPLQMDDLADWPAGNGECSSSAHEILLLNNVPVPDGGGIVTGATGAKDGGSTANSSSTRPDQAEHLIGFSQLLSRCQDNTDGPDARAVSTPQMCQCSRAFQSTPAEPRNDSLKCGARAVHCAQQDKLQCSCSQAALRSLDRLSAAREDMQYISSLEAAQHALGTVEEMALCAVCVPALVVTKCCLLLSSAYELLNKVVSLSLNEIPSPSSQPPGSPRVQVQEGLSRVKRRAAMLLAGLGTLQDLDSTPGPLLAAVQADFLAALAKSWSTLGL